MSLIVASTKCSCAPERPLQVARELTKLHEEQIGPTTGAALKHFLANKPIGECTIVLGGNPNKLNIQLSKAEFLAEMKTLINEGATVNEAAKIIAQTYGHPKRSLYALLHNMNTNDGN